MIKTTRIKFTQAPQVIADDLSSQCDGKKQVFSLKYPVDDNSPYSLIFNGQVYNNTPEREWFTLSRDRMTITTHFKYPPMRGENKNLILLTGVVGINDVPLSDKEISERVNTAIKDLKQYVDNAIASLKEEYGKE